MSDTKEKESQVIPETPAKKTASAKEQSKWAQVIAAIWIAGWSAFKFISNSAEMTVEDIMLSGIGIAAIFTPVYFSIILDKIKDIRLGKGA